MNEHSDPSGMQPRRHPPVETIEDVITYKLAQLVGINERAGQHWSEQLFDLSLNEWRMLALVQARSRVRAGDLADMMLMDKSQLSRLIKSLQAKRVLKTAPDKEDARAVVLSVTKRGQALYHEVMAEVMHRNENVLAALSVQEVAVFDSLLSRLIEHNLMLLRSAAHDQG